MVEQNFKLFEDLDGLKTIIGCLNFGFKEIKNIQKFKTWMRNKAHNQQYVDGNFLDVSSASEIDFDDAQTPGRNNEKNLLRSHRENERFDA